MCLQALLLREMCFSGGGGGRYLLRLAGGLTGQGSCWEPWWLLEVQPAASDRMCRNGAKLCQQRSRLHVKIKFFTVRVIKCSNRLPRGVVYAPSFPVFKRRLDNAPSNLL